jgi:hypothetical protein
MSSIITFQLSKYEGGYEEDWFHTTSSEGLGLDVGL